MKREKVSKTANHIVLAMLSVTLLSGCVVSSDQTVVDYRNATQNYEFELVLITSNGFDNDIIKALATQNIRVKPFATINRITDKSTIKDVEYNEAEARYGLKHWGDLDPGRNPCLTNSKSYYFSEYTLQLVDLSTNEFLFEASMAGGTASCPGVISRFGATKNIFGDLSVKISQLIRSID